LIKTPRRPANGAMSHVGFDETSRFCSAPRGSALEHKPGTPAGGLCCA
jgi:hypothetical protein